jgi:hypothetical protein
MSNKDSQPAFRVFSVIPREGKDAIQAKRVH